MTNKWRFWVIGAMLMIVGATMCYVGRRDGIEELGRWSMFVNGISVGCMVCFRMSDE